MIYNINLPYKFATLCISQFFKSQIFLGFNTKSNNYTNLLIN